MENEIAKSDDKRLGFVKELVRIAYDFGHDDTLFRRKVFEFINIDSLKEKEVVQIEETMLDGEIRTALNENKLTEKEFELCCLMQQGFTTEEISVILGLKTNKSVHVKQSRLKKKLKGEISPEIVLVMLIMSIIAWIVLKLLHFPGF